jgi:hypothetical protein
MKVAIAAVAALIGVLAMHADAESTASSAVDSLTNLPLPAGDTLQLGEATKLQATSICASKMQADFFTPSGGKVDAALAWYAAHLNAFKRTHGYWSGRSQDTFYNAAGTLIVSVTGMPAKEGMIADVYSVLYARIQPGLAEKTILSLNAPKVVCP